MRPNLFDYATSELSQDAILCWLLAWATPEHQTLNTSLHQVGTDLLRLVFPHLTIRKIEVRRQVGKIDILCIVNDEFAIIIEDKTGTIQHSDQLARYKIHGSEHLGFSVEKIIPVYVQTGDQSDYVEVIKHGYTILERSCLLQILESPNGLTARKGSDTLDDFGSYLRSIENDVQSYRILPIQDWTWNAWRGFFSEVQRRLGYGNWNYVPNQNGGFLAFYWHFSDFEDGTVFLQLEQEKFCFKIAVKNPAKQTALRHHWHDLVVTNCKTHGLKVKRPPRFGKGNTMTVAILDHDYRSTAQDGILLIEETIDLLRTAQKVLNDCFQQPHTDHHGDY